MVVVLVGKCQVGRLFKFVVDNGVFTVKYMVAIFSANWDNR